MDGVGQPGWSSDRAVIPIASGEEERLPVGNAGWMLDLTETDKAPLCGDFGSGVALAMRIVVDAVQTMGATCLLDITSAHVASLDLLHQEGSKLVAIQATHGGFLTLPRGGDRRFIVEGSDNRSEPAEGRVQLIDNPLLIRFRSRLKFRTVHAPQSYSNSRYCHRSSTFRWLAPGSVSVA